MRLVENPITLKCHTDWWCWKCWLSCKVEDAMVKMLEQFDRTLERWDIWKTRNLRFKILWNKSETLSQHV